MPDATELIKLIKKTAIEAFIASKPAQVSFGSVISEQPLKISVDQKLILGEKQLILTRSVTDHETEMTQESQTEDEEIPVETLPPENDENYTSDQDPESEEADTPSASKTTIKNKLKVGESVVLLRMQGGQKYIVLDRVVLHDPNQ